MKNRLKVIIGVLIVIIVGLSYFLIRNTNHKILLRDAYKNCFDNYSNSREKALCTKELAKKAVNDLSLGQIELEIETVYGTESIDICHEFMHYVGWEFYDKKKSLSESFKEAEIICGNGMYHGIVERYLSQSTHKYSLENELSKFSKVCEAEDDDFSTQCNHGMGHAFMIITENDIPASIKNCEVIDQKYVTNCMHAVLMEGVFPKEADKVAGHALPYVFDVNNPDYPCNLVKAVNQEECYKRLGGVFGKSDVEFQDAFSNCKYVKEEFRDDCSLGVGRRIFRPGWSLTNQAQKCEPALEINKASYEACISSVLFFVFNANIGKPEGVEEFCGAVKENFRNYCYQESGNIMREWTLDTDIFAKRCRELNSNNAINSCLKSI